MTRTVRFILALAWVVLLAAVLVLVLALAGCAKRFVPLGGTIITGEGIARADSHIQSAEVAVVAAKDDAGEVGKTYLSVASREHHAASASLFEASVGLSETRLELAKVQGELAEARAQWGYRAWAWIKPRISFVLFLYCLLGFGGSILTTATGGVWGTFGKEILRFLPAANWFKWIVNLGHRLGQGG